MGFAMEPLIVFPRQWIGKLVYFKAPPLFDINLVKSESNLILTLRMSLLPPPLFVQISLSSLGLSENSKIHPNTHQSITNSWRRWVLGPSSIGAQLEPFMQEPVSKSPAERKAGNQRWATSLTPGRFVKNKTIVLLLCYFLAFRWVLDGSSSLLCCSVW